MRPLETLLLFADLLVMISLAARPPRAIRRVRHTAPIALLIAIAQMAMEGPRWQMVPAYALTLLLVLVWLQRQVAEARNPDRRRQGNWLVARIAIGLGVLGLAVSVALPAALPVFRFPVPSGPYAIGTVSYHWIDADRAEVFSTAPNARRELMAQVWYPSVPSQDRSQAPYVPDAQALSAALTRLHGLPAFTLEHLQYVMSNATPSARVSQDQPNFPVLIFLEGLTGYRQMNTFQVEELVSHGYIVVAIDQPYVAASVVFPDGRQVDGLSKGQIDGLIQQSVYPIAPAPILNDRLFEAGIIPYFAQDVRFTLDRLAALNAEPDGMLSGKLDMQRVGAFGVSIGGIAVGEACRVESRLRACLMMDAPMTESVSRASLLQPSMWITRDNDTMRLEGWSSSDIDQHQATMWSAFQGSRGRGYFVRVPGLFHANLTDTPHFSPLSRQLGLSGPIGAQRAHAIVNAYSLAFFDRHLRDMEPMLLNQQAVQYPEVLLDLRQP